PASTAAGCARRSRRKPPAQPRRSDASRQCRRKSRNWMPRDGSRRPAGDAVPLAPMDIGELANPPFAVLPDPASVFQRRAERFAVLAPGHQLEAYLRLLAEIAQVQHDIIDGLPPPVLPSAERLELART